ncbi:DUF3892 domain-containing protein [Amycolatopsis sp. CA-230715]|uniref:DUF3892 domain-containing protein n=1 Tax=Amycolatopsis sp. CA-230715 TaxID=2745196 RepID=UPI001C03214A|nr:DUF3892 domain-containing protein [Amycolatopsis sp. CA-230715]QWF83117.1 hypothetical protein HUW46_06557 [Amycolatopsis sp. CA-230715]
MARVLVEYTHKIGDDHRNPHQRIRGIGGNGSQGWYLGTAEVIADIRAGRNSYYVTDAGRQLDVVLASYAGVVYLKTTADGYAPNKLLGLPEPPVRLMH